MFEIENKVIDIASCTLLDNEDGNYLSAGEAIDEIWKLIKDTEYEYSEILKAIMLQDIDKVTDDQCLEAIVDFIANIKEEPW